MGQGWRPVRVRCLEGGRARQTPAFIKTRHGWRPLRLISESLRAGTTPESGHERRFLVEDPGGSRLELKLVEDAWLARNPKTAMVYEDQLD